MSKKLIFVGAGFGLAHLAAVMTRPAGSTSTGSSSGSGSTAGQSPPFNPADTASNV